MRNDNQNAALFKYTHQLLFMTQDHMARDHFLSVDNVDSESSSVAWSLNTQVSECQLLPTIRKNFQTSKVLLPNMSATFEWRIGDIVNASHFQSSDKPEFALVVLNQPIRSDRVFSSLWQNGMSHGMVMI